MKFNSTIGSKFSLSLIILATVSAVVSADELEIALSTDSVRGEYFRNFSVQSGIGGSGIPIGLLYNRDEEFAGNVGFTVTGVPADQNPTIIFGVGANVYGARIKKDDDETAFGLALGGKAQYIFPAEFPVHVVGELYYAPNITTISDGDSILDFKARVEFELVPQTAVFAGYNLLRVGLESGGDANLNDNAQVGIRMSF